MIADQKNSNCVDHALSICRLALGYTGDIFQDAIDRPKSIAETIKLAAEWFPLHALEFYSSQEEYESIDQMPENCTWLGNYAEHIETKDRICLFAYKKKGTTLGHFVIGFPMAYGDMEIYLVILINGVNSRATTWRK